MTSIQGAHQLCEDGPNEVLISVLIPTIELLDISSQISVAAELHVKMQIMTALQMLAVAILDDVRMSKGLEDAEFGV